MVVPQDQTTPEPERTIFPVPKFTVLALLLLEANAPVTVSVSALRLTIPVVKIMLPKVGLPDRLRVMSLLLIVTDGPTALAATETVAAVPLLASKNIRSAATGADAPGAPPDVADQFAVEVASQVPEPPTQYLFAICVPYSDPASVITR